MAHRYLAFDLETVKEVPGDDFSKWRLYRPLGISCAATLLSGTDQPRLWYSRTQDGQPAKQMSREDAMELVQYLSKMATEGIRILTWNGLGFDFDILAEESTDYARCKKCARNHVDMMFHIVCCKGHRLKLEKAAEGMGLPGKASGMSGKEAPRLWAQRQYEKVFKYVAQDARITLQIAQGAERGRELVWITQRGTKSSMSLTRGWLTVPEALRLPEPDTSWMPEPPSRQDFTAWLDRHS